MSNLIAFHFNDITVRTQLTDDGEPLFCAKDICTILGYINPRDALRQHVDSNYGVVKRDVIDVLNRT